MCARTCIDIGLWISFSGLTLVVVGLSMRVSRLRETLRRHNIVHDETKPWEGA